MMRTNVIKRFSSAMIVVLLLLALMPLTAVFAADTELEFGVTISYRDGDKPIIGAEFKLFFVASVDETGKSTPTEAFERYFGKISTDSADTLEAYVLRDNISPCDSGKTDANGIICFPTAENKLERGVYLVIGERHEQNGKRYDAVPFFVVLPGKSNTVGASVKFESTDVPNGDDTVKRKVVKLWKDDGHESDRPKEVTVQLLKNGDIYDTVILNAENNWRYEWDALDGDAKWTVTEKEIEGYTVEITREGVSFAIANTRTDDTPDDTPSKPSLPQTGQLWWPVPVFFCAGLICLVIGFACRRGEYNEK